MTSDESQTFFIVRRDDDKKVAVRLIVAEIYDGLSIIKTRELTPKDYRKVAEKLKEIVDELIK